MKKHEALAHWRSLPENVDPLPLMSPIPYKASGSTYGACGIRIDGTPAFIDAVLGRLKPILAGENNVTRLGLARNTVDGSGLKKELPNAVEAAQCCYIRLHMRGEQGAAASYFFDKDLHAATRQYAAGLGIKTEV